MRRNLGLDGAPGQLVPEAERASPRPAADRPRPARRRSPAPPRRPGRPAGGPPARSRARPGPGSARAASLSRAARESTASRADAGTSVPCSLSTSHDEERVAAGELVQLVGGVRRALGQAADAGRGERRQVDAAGVALAGELAEGDPERVGRARSRRRGRSPAAAPGRSRIRRPRNRSRSRVASSAHCASSTTSTATSVDGRGAPQHGVEDLVARRGAAHHVEQVPADLAGDVVQRRERSGREQAVAGTPGPRRVGQPVLELLDERGLADAGLTGDQDEATRARAGLVGVLEQRPELRLPLEQGHVLDSPPPRRLRPCSPVEEWHGWEIRRGASVRPDSGVPGQPAGVDVVEEARRPSPARGSAGGSARGVTSSARAASWSATTWNGCHDASTPADAETRSWSSSSVEEAIAQRVCGTTRIRSTPSRWTPSTSASSAWLGDAAAGVAEDLGVAVPETEHGQRHDAGVHAGHDRDAGMGDAVEAALVEGLGVRRVGGERDRRSRRRSRVHPRTRG